MGRSTHVTPAERQRVIKLRQNGKKFKEIAKDTGLAISTCIKAAKHVQSTGSIQNKVRTRRHKTTARDDRKIHRLSEANRHKTAVDIHEEVSGQLSNDISVRTVQRRLNEFGLMGRVARKKPFISKKNQKARIKFAKEHLNWTQEQWSKVSQNFKFR